MVTFSLLARPCLMHIQGANYNPPLRLPVPVGFSRGEESRDEYMRVKFVDGRAQPSASQNSGVLSSALTAEGLLHLPSERKITEGEMLDFIPFGSLLTV